MSTIRRGEPGAKEASGKWRRTMVQKYGGEEALAKRMAQVGSIGGRKSHGGGFSQNPALARIAGAKGGRTSRRGASVQGLIEEHKDDILSAYRAGASVPQIAKNVGVSYTTLLKWFHKNVSEYGRNDDEE